MLLEGVETLIFWSWREELNLQPAVYKTATMPFHTVLLQRIK